MKLLIAYIGLANAFQGPRYPSNRFPTSIRSFGSYLDNLSSPPPSEPVQPAVPDPPLMNQSPPPHESQFVDHQLHSEQDPSTAAAAAATAAVGVVDNDTSTSTSVDPEAVTQAITDNTNAFVQYVSNSDVTTTPGSPWEKKELNVVEDLEETAVEETTVDGVESVDSVDNVMHVPTDTFTFPGSTPQGTSTFRTMPMTTTDSYQAQYHQASATTTSSSSQVPDLTTTVPITPPPIQEEPKVEEPVVAETTAPTNYEMPASSEPVTSSNNINQERHDQAHVPTTPNNTQEKTNVAVQISSTLNTFTQSSLFSPSTPHSYRQSKETLRGSRQRNQKLINRSAYEQERTNDKINKLKETFDEEKRLYEVEMKEKVMEAQAKIDEETTRITNIINQEIEKESERERTTLDLINNLGQAMQQMEKDMEHERKYMTDLLEVRSRQDQGSPISEQLDRVISEKSQVASLDASIMQDMMLWIGEAQGIMEGAKERNSKMKHALAGIVWPDATSTTHPTYLWDGITEVEEMLEQASILAEMSDEKFRNLKVHFDNSFLRKAKILKLEVPEDIIKGTQTKVSLPFMDKMMVKKDSGTPSSLLQPYMSSIDWEDLSDKDEKELLSILGKSFSTAASSGLKASYHAIKGFVDSVQEKSVTEATEQALEKSNDIGKGLSSFSRNVKKTKQVKSQQDLQNIANDPGLQLSLKSTGDTVDAFGKAGKTLMENLESSPQVTEARYEWEEASEDFLSAFNAFSTLGRKGLEQTAANTGLISEGESLASIQEKLLDDLKNNDNLQKIQNEMDKLMHTKDEAVSKLQQLSEMTKGKDIQHVQQQMDQIFKSDSVEEVPQPIESNDIPENDAMKKIQQQAHQLTNIDSLKKVREHFDELSKKLNEKISKKRKH